LLMYFKSKRLRKEKSATQYIMTALFIFNFNGVRVQPNYRPELG